MTKRLTGPQRGQEQVSTSDYLKTIHRIIIRRMPLIIGLIALCAVVALTVSILMKPVYEASASLRIQRQSNFLPGTDTPIYSGNSSLEAEAMWIKSRPILVTVMNKLGIGAEAKNDREFLEIMEELRDNMEVIILPDSNVLNISVRWHEPALTKEVANTTADVFIEKYTAFTQGKAKETTSFIQEQLEVVELNLSRAQNKVSRFQKEEATFSLDQKIASLNSQLTQLESKKAQVDMDLQLAEMEKKTLMNQLNMTDEEFQGLGLNYSAISTKNMLDNDLVQGLRARIAQIESDIVSLSTLYTDEYPMLKQKREELKNVREKLNNTLYKLVGGVDLSDKDAHYQDQMVELVSAQAEIESLGRQSDTLDGLIADIKSKINVLPDKHIEYANMLREENVNEQLYNLLLAKLQEAKIREKSNEWDIRIWERANEPIDPVKPRPILNTVFGSILGLLLGLSVSMMIEYFDDSFRTVSDVEEYLGLPVLAAIPKLKHHKNIDNKEKEKLRYNRR